MAEMTMTEYDRFLEDDLESDLSLSEREGKFFRLV